jgi:hypothetical protein
MLSVPLSPLSKLKMVAITSTLVSSFMSSFVNVYERYDEAGKRWNEAMGINNIDETYTLTDDDSEIEGTWHDASYEPDEEKRLKIQSTEKYSDLVMRKLKNNKDPTYAQFVKYMESKQHELANSKPSKEKDEEFLRKNDMIRRLVEACPKDADLPDWIKLLVKENVLTSEPDEVEPTAYEYGDVKYENGTKKVFGEYAFRDVALPGMKGFGEDDIDENVVESDDRVKENVPKYDELLDKIYNELIDELPPPQNEELRAPDESIDFTGDSLDIMRFFGDNELDRSATTLPYTLEMDHNETSTDDFEFNFDDEDELE